MGWFILVGIGLLVLFALPNEGEKSTFGGNLLGIIGILVAVGWVVLFPYDAATVALILGLPLLIVWGVFRIMPCVPSDLSLTACRKMYHRWRR